MLSLPLWIVTEHIQTSDSEKISDNQSAGTAIAFGASEKLFEFMRAHRGGEWKMQMAADRDGLVILIADLHRLEITLLVLDPALDGTGGEQLALADLIAFADSLR